MFECLDLLPSYTINSFISHLSALNAVEEVKSEEIKSEEIKSEEIGS